MGYGCAAALGTAVVELLRRARGRGASGRLCALKSREERGGLGRLRCGGEDRFLVGLQDGKPGREILRVIGARLVGDAEIGAEESGSEFGDQFLHRVGLVAEALAELPIAAALGARPVGQFMAEASNNTTSAGVLVGVPMKASRGGS